VTTLLLAIIAIHRGVTAQLASIGTYVALGGSVIVVEELAPVLAGFAAHQNHLPVYRTVAVCALGGWLATLVPYLLGRYGARALLRRFPQAEETSRRLTEVVGRRPWRSGLASRFLFGARFLLPLAAGTARVRRMPFLIGAAISAVVWASAFFTLGWAFGDAMVVLLGHVRRNERTIGLLLAAVVLLIVLIVNRKNRAHVPEELERLPG
jgi:membrane protein DedA with SNARE-associated domain